MTDNKYEVNYNEYVELKYQLTFELKTLTENVNRLTQTFEKKFDEQDGKITDLERCLQEKRLQEAKGGTNEGSSSLPSNIKWLMVLILGIAFLGALGAAIGVNLLGYLDTGVIPQ